MCGGGGASSSSGTPSFLINAYSKFLDEDVSGNDWGSTLHTQIANAIDVGRNPYEQINLITDYFDPEDFYQLALSTVVSYLISGYDLAGTSGWSALWDAINEKIPSIRASIDIPTNSDIVNAAGAFSVPNIGVNYLSTSWTSKLGISFGTFYDIMNAILNNVRSELPYVKEAANLNATTEIQAAIDVGVTKGINKADTIISDGAEVAYNVADDFYAQASPVISANLVTQIALFVTASLSKIDDAFDAAVLKASSVINSSTISTLVDSFEIDSNPEFLRGVARFAGGMADINAVHSTSFIVGMGIMERGRVNELTKLGAEFKNSLYRETLPLYIQSFSNVFASYLQGYMKDFDVILQTYLKSSDDFTKISFEIATNYIKDLLNKIQQNVDMWKSTLDAVNTQEANLIGQFSTYMGTVYTGMMQAYIEGKKAEELIVGDYINKGFSELARGYTQQAAFKEVGIKLQAAMQEKKLVIDKEYYQLELEKRYGKEMWVIETYMKYANAVAAFSGASVMTESRPSQLKTALGGAMGGAAMGSTLGPIGAVAGGIIGGFAGLLG